MSADPHTAQQRRNRRVLTAAQKKGPRAVIDAANMLYNEMYTRNVWPDSWAEVQRAHDDAQLQLRLHPADACQTETGSEVWL